MPVLTRTRGYVSEKTTPYINPTMSENTANIAMNLTLFCLRFRSAYARRTNDVGDRVSHRRTPVGRCQEDAENLQAKRMQPCPACDVFLFDLRVEGRNEFSERKRVNVAQIDEQEGGGDWCQSARRLTVGE